MAWKCVKMEDGCNWILVHADTGKVCAQLSGKRCSKDAPFAIQQELLALSRPLFAF